MFVSLVPYQVQRIVLLWLSSARVCLQVLTVDLTNQSLQYCQSGAVLNAAHQGRCDCPLGQVCLQLVASKSYL